VAPLDASRFNNDEVFLRDILNLISDTDNRIGILPSRLNCCQLKDIIARCRFFIGGRTHATIAALSSEVPTVSIAYSIKARGINLDLFGHERLVLPTPDYSCATLIKALTTLETMESDIRELLNKQIPIWKERAHLSAELFSKRLLD
jgi:colanic acid/amylovoran biosynthesis protein